MPFYLNHRAQIMCIHGGQVELIPPAFRSFWVNGSPILTKEDLLLTDFIIGCPQAGPGIVPCTKIVTLLTGVAMFFQVDSLTPVLDTLDGITDGVPPGGLIVVFNGLSDCETYDF